MTILYLSYTAGYTRPFEDFIEFAHNKGFSGVELIPDLPPNLPEELTQERINTLLSLKKQYGMQFTVHNIYMDINPTSLVPRVRQLAEDITVDVLHFTKDVQAQALIVHTGYQFSPWRSKPEQVEMFAKVQMETYRKLANISHDVGVTVLIENGNYYLSGRNTVKQPLHIGIHVEELMEIVAIPEGNPFGICFDVGKAYFSVDDCSQDKLLDYLKRVSPLLREVHINQFQGYKEVLPPIISYLESIDYKYPIVFECGTNGIDELLSLFR